MDNKIDFVLPWVDSSDTKWQQEKNKYEQATDTDDVHASTRFRDMETLKFVLRSIEKNAPWFNKIHLITIGHIPEWLDISHPKINHITHEELYFDPTHLPTFNSQSIEMNLANMKDVSENFVYLNDDTLIMHTVEKNRFFQNNKPIDFFAHGWIPRGKVFEFFRGKDNWIDALRNSIRLINQKHQLIINQKHLYHHSYDLKDKMSNYLYKNIYKKIFWIKHWHNPQPYLFSNIKEVQKTYDKEMRECSQNKFRSSSDLAPYLYRYWHLVKGDFIPYNYNDGFVAKISSLYYLQSAIEKIKQNSTINFVCFNDQMNDVSQDEFEHVAIVLEDYLEGIFPDKASFER